MIVDDFIEHESLPGVPHTRKGVATGVTTMCSASPRGSRRFRGNAGGVPAQPLIMASLYWRRAGGQVATNLRVSCSQGPTV